MMEAVSTSENVVSFSEATRRNIPQSPSYSPPWKPEILLSNNVSRPKFCVQLLFVAYYKGGLCLSLSILLY
jgi:hypothetical protein